MPVLGFEVRRKDGLLVPYYLHHAEAQRETLAREAAFSFPLAALGFTLGGPVGVVGGHIAGALLGLARHQRIHGPGPGGA